MQIPAQDLLTPLRSDDNRDEHILIEYDGFIQSLSEAIIYNLLLNKDKYISKYPLLTLFEELNSYDIYDTCFLYTPEYLLYYLSGQTVSDEHLASDINELLKNNVSGYQQDILFEYAIYNLLAEDFTKSVHIVNRYGFKVHDIQRLRFKFPSTFKKITLMDNDKDISELINNFDYTTVCLNDINELIELPEKVNKEKLQNIFFIIRNVNDAIAYEESGSVSLRYNDELNLLRKNYNLKIGRVFTMRLEKPDSFPRPNPLNKVNERIDLI